MWPFLATPTTLHATSLAAATAARGRSKLVAASLRAVADCTTAPEPSVPPVTTPLHCDTIHWQLATLPANLIVRGPVPGDPLNSRKMTTRLVGEPCVSKSTLATRSQAAIPPPVTVGVSPPPERRVRTATVMSALGAGEIEAVV